MIFAETVVECADGAVVPLRIDEKAFTLASELLGCDVPGGELDGRLRHTLGLLWAFVVRHAEVRGEEPPLNQGDLFKLMLKNAGAFASAVHFLLGWLDLQQAPPTE